MFSLLRRRTLLCMLAALPLLSVSLTASAQRQTAGRPSLEAWSSFGSVSGKFTFAGGGITWNAHDYLGRTFLGVEANLDLESGQTVSTMKRVDAEGLPYEEKVWSPAEAHAWDVCATGGYAIRVWAPRSRTVIFSAGLGAYLGARIAPGVSEMVRLDDEGYYVTPKSVGFVFGLLADIQFEVFPFRNVSLYLSFRPRFSLANTLETSHGFARIRTCAGLKYYF